jgi:hypothetical protein
MFWKKRVKQPAGLISVLLDSSAEFGDRDDAAMDLEAFDEPEAEEALLTIALDPMVDEFLADRAGESIWGIWKRKQKYDANIVRKMHPAARKFFD